VLNSNQVNAFSAPGGYVFITRALYDQAPTDDLLAGILAHEIGHITGKHALNIIRRDELMSGGSSLLDKYSSDYRGAKTQVGSVDAQLQQFDVGVGKITKALLEKGFDAPTEFKADQTGHDLAKLTGYAPGGLRAVLTSLQKSGGKSKAVFSTHPPLADRLQKLPDDPAPPTETAPAVAVAQKPAGQKQALSELLAKLSPGSPVEIARVNGQQVRLQTFPAASAWSRADTGDLLLQVVRGSVMVEFRAGPVALGVGEFLVIPRDTEYHILADATAAALVVSPAAKNP
jgi:predicted Zn-dependent protease